FEGIENTILKRVGTNAIGFKASSDENLKLNKGELLARIQPEDLLKFGLIPEIIGRLPVLATLNELDKKVLLDILSKPKNAILKQYKKLFEIEGIKLRFTDNVLSEIIDITIQKKMGARGLRSVIEEIMLDIMFKIPSIKGVKEVVINKDVLKKKKEPVIILKDVKKGA
ncbi:ATP-dependent Clp protease ATP-binding subunit ClpX, partial [bacterium]|nr:ATP-dependent Clp protease ATP-binding subunit ClpX [bacterium]